MSLSLEDYIAKSKRTTPDVCFKVNNQHRRFKVYTNKETYAFPWIHVVYSTLSRDEREVIVHLTQHIIEVTGDHLVPIHEAIVQDSLEFIRMLPRALLSLEATEGTVIQHIEVQERAAFKPSTKTKLDN